MIELQLLRYAHVAAETGSFSRAADRFGVKQSTLSDSIRYLESRLGLPLFSRSTRGVVPTDPGRRFLQRARHIIDDVERLLSDTKMLANAGAGTLRIGFHTTLAAGDLSASLAAFRAVNAAVEIEGSELNRAALLHAVEGGQIDLAVTTGRASCAGLRSLCLWSEPLIAAVPNNHPLAGREELAWADLRDATLVISADDPGPDIRAIINARLAAPGCTPDIRVQRVARENLPAFADAGSIVIGTGFLVRRGPNAPTLHQLHDGFTATSLDQSLVWRSDNDSAPLRRFLAMIAERYGRDIDA